MQVDTYLTHERRRKSFVFMVITAVPGQSNGALTSKNHVWKCHLIATFIIDIYD